MIEKDTLTNRTLRTRQPRKCYQVRTREKIVVSTNFEGARRRREI